MQTRLLHTILKNKVEKKHKIVRTILYFFAAMDYLSKNWGNFGSMLLSYLI